MSLNHNIFFYFKNLRCFRFLIIFFFCYIFIIFIFFLHYRLSYLFRVVFEHTSLEVALALDLRLEFVHLGLDGILQLCEKKMKKNPNNGGI